MEGKRVGQRPCDQLIFPTGDQRLVRLESTGDEPSTARGTLTSLDTDFHYVDISADSGWDTDLEAEGKLGQMAEEDLGFPPPPPCQLGSNTVFCQKFLLKPRRFCSMQFILKGGGGGNSNSLGQGLINSG